MQEGVSLWVGMMAVGLGCKTTPAWFASWVKNRHHTCLVTNAKTALSVGYL